MLWSSFFQKSATSAIALDTLHGSVARRKIIATGAMESVTLRGTASVLPMSVSRFACRAEGASGNVKFISSLALVAKTRKWIHRKLITFSELYIHFMHYSWHKSTLPWLLCILVGFNLYVISQILQKPVPDSSWPCETLKLEEGLAC